jgi:hypothetical protein
MEKFLDQLLNSDLLTEDSKNELRESFKTVLEEAQEAAREEARAELAEQYKEDRGRLIEALDKMARESITAHLTEFKQDVDRLHVAKAKAAKAIAEADDRAAKKARAVIKTLEESNRKVIKREIGELVEDFKLQRAQHVKLMKEGRAKLANEKKALVSKMAKVLEHLTRKQLKSIMESYKEDIIRARQNNFGRKMFEAFASEFESSYFSRDRVLDTIKSELAEAKKAKAVTEAAAKKKIAALTESKKNIEGKLERITESVARTRKVNSLLKPLTGNAKAQMKELLEGVPAERLDGTFKKYLPHVTESVSKGRKRLSESKTSQRRSLGSFHSGSREAILEDKAVEVEEVDRDIEALRRKLPR